MKKRIMIGAAAALTIVFVIVAVSIALNSGMKAALTVYNSNGKEIQASTLKAGESFTAHIDIDLTQAKEYKNTEIVMDIPDGVFLDEVQKSDIVQEVVKEDGKAVIRLNAAFRGQPGCENEYAGCKVRDRFCSFDRFSQIRMRQPAD